MGLILYGEQRSERGEVRNWKNETVRGWEYSYQPLDFIVLKDGTEFPSLKTEMTFGTGSDPFKSSQGLWSIDRLSLWKARLRLPLPLLLFRYFRTVYDSPVFQSKFIANPYPRKRSGIM